MIDSGRGRGKPANDPPPVSGEPTAAAAGPSGRVKLRATPTPFRAWPWRARALERIYRLTHGGRARTVVIRYGRGRAECWDMPEHRWALERFTGRCYFYPDRDCPGWTTGRPCGRIGEVIPRQTEAGCR